MASSSLGEAITFSIASQPTGGQVTINGSEATYNPNSGFYGLDSFNITATSASSSEIIPISIDVFNNPYKDYEISDITAISTTYENDELDGSYTNYSCMYPDCSPYMHIHTCIAKAKVQDALRGRTDEATGSHLEAFKNLLCSED